MAGEIGDAGGISSLLQNKMFLQYLMGAGADVAQGTGGKNINAAVQGNIQAQNMMKLLKTLLGPDGTKGTISSTGLNLTIPKESELFSTILGGETGATGTSPTNLTSVSQGANAGGMYGSGGGPNIANPFVTSQPNMDISASDLAGLTTQDISAVIGAKHNQEQLKQQSFRDMIDAIYKGEQITQSRAASAVDIPYKKALTKQAEAATLENTPSVDITVGDRTMKVTPKDAIAWEKMKKETTPAEIKLFEYARDKQGFKGSIIDFKNAEWTGHKKDYKDAVADGYGKSFHEWMLEMAKAGAINLGEKVEAHKALSELKGLDYFNDPRWTGDIDKHLGSKDVRRRLMSADKPELESSKETIKFVEGKIAAGGGKVVRDPTIEGDTMTWIVKFPAGIKEINVRIR